MQRLLDQTIHHRRNAQRAYPALRLRYLHLAHRRRQVLARQQRLSYLRPVRLEPWFQLRHRESVDSRCACVGHHALIGTQQVAAFHHGFHQPQRFRFRFSRSRRTSLRTRAPSRQVPPVFAGAGRTRVRFCFIGSHRGLLSYSRVSCSALRCLTAQLLWPRLTSDDPSPRLATPVARKQTARSPRVLRTHLPAYACRIYVTALRASTGLCVYWPAYPAAPPLSASCSSGQRFAYSFLQIPPRDGHPCRSANTFPCRVCRGLSPPSECALPGAPSNVGRGLLTHELAHVLQQDGGRTAGVVQRREVDDRSCAGLTDIKSDVNTEVNNEIGAARADVAAH